MNSLTTLWFGFLLNYLFFTVFTSHEQLNFAKEKKEEKLHSENGCPHDCYLFAVKSISRLYSRTHRIGEQLMLH